MSTSKMTKAQLVDENIRLRAHIDVLESKLHQAESVREVEAPVRPSLEVVAHLQSRGMPRMFQFGREVVPSPKQVAYWASRLSATH